MAFRSLLRLSLGAAVAGWAQARCHWGDKCYVVPVAGWDVPGQPNTMPACTPDCHCYHVGHGRGGWTTVCDEQCAARLAGQPSSCHEGVLTCDDPVRDAPTADKAACVPKAWNVTRVYSQWTLHQPAGYNRTVGLHGDGAQASSPGWGAAVTAFLKTHPVTFGMFRMSEVDVATRVGLLDQFASQWERPQWPVVETPIDFWSIYWAHDLYVQDNSAAGSVYISLNNFVFTEAPPCCFPGFCANAACDTCTGADMLIPGSDAQRCKVAAVAEPSLVL